MPLQLLILFALLAGPPDAELVARITQLPEPTHASTATLQAFREARALLQDADNRPCQRFRKAKAAAIMGEIYLCFKLDGLAETCFQYAQAGIPREPRWPYYRGVIAVNDVRLEQAAALLWQAYQLALADPSVDDDQLVAILAELGNVYLDMGQIDDAEQNFELAMTWIPDAPAALWGLGRVASARGNQEKAIAQFQRLLTLLPQAKSVHVQIGDAHRKLGNFEQAKAHYAQVPPRQPNWVFGKNPFRARLDSWDEAQRHYAQGEIALSQLEFKLAEEQFRKALEIDPQTNFRRGLAIALLKQNRLDEAQGQFQAVIDELPTDSIGLSFMGSIATQRGAHATALEFYQRILAKEPNNLHAMSQSGVCLWRLCDADGAIERFSQVLKQDPSATDARLAVVQIHRERHEDALALACLEDAPKRSDEQIDRALAILLSCSGNDAVRDGRRALQLAEALTKRNSNPENKEILAAAYAECGQFDEAIALQQDLLSQTKDLPQLVIDRRNINLERYLAKQPCRNLW